MAMVSLNILVRTVVCRNAFRKGKLKEVVELMMGREVLGEGTHVRLL